MKKISFLSFILAFSFLSICSAQDVGWISVYFCNDWESTKSLNLVAQAGIESEICMDFANSSENDITINYWFVDGTVTADEYKNKACLNEWDIEKFGQYVTQNVNEIVVPSMQVVRQKAYVKFPVWLSGMMNWCLTYYVKDDWWQGEWMFNVLVRKAAFVDVLVGWEMKRDLKISDKNLFNYTYDKKTKKYNLEVIVDNLWNVDENVVITWEISNGIWFINEFTSDKERVVFDSTENFDIELWELPWYKMNYKVTLHVVWNPEFTFSPDLVPDYLKEPTTIDLSFSIFVFPWVLVYCLGWLIILIILISFLAKHLKFQ